MISDEKVLQTIVSTIHRRVEMTRLTTYHVQPMLEQLTKEFDFQLKYYPMSNNGRKIRFSTGYSHMDYTDLIQVLTITDQIENFMTYLQDVAVPSLILEQMVLDFTF
ncbi:MAG: hypothetical protein ABS939_02650 [Psychrobacillus sp.]